MKNSIELEPEFVHKGAATGCQSLCDVKGLYNGSPIDTQIVLEIIGNLCG
jgi:hypothetical protein